MITWNPFRRTSLYILVCWSAWPVYNIFIEMSVRSLPSLLYTVSTHKFDTKTIIFIRVHDKYCLYFVINKNARRIRLPEKGEQNKIKIQSNDKGWIYRVDRGNTFFFKIISSYLFFGGGGGRQVSMDDHGYTISFVYSILNIYLSAGTLFY